MSAPAFVTVRPSGIPAGYDTAAEALDALFLAVGGEWDTFRDYRPGAAAALESAGEYSFFWHQNGGSPFVAAVFDNRRDRRPLSSFTNWHLHARPESWTYIETARAAWGARADGPRVGDYVRHLDGTETRFTHNWGDGLQAGGGCGSYHISRDGFASYSGGLSDRIPLDRLADTGESKPGEFWFFLDGWTGAHRGVYVQLPCRVYQETKESEQ